MTRTKAREQRTPPVQYMSTSFPSSSFLVSSFSSQPIKSVDFHMFGFTAKTPCAFDPPPPASVLLPRGQELGDAPQLLRGAPQLHTVTFRTQPRPVRDARTHRHAAAG